MRVGDFCNREVVSIEEDASIIDAAIAMRENHVGDLIVVKKSFNKLTPVGIITDRDLALGVVAAEIDMHSVTVGDTMSFELASVSEDDDLMHANENMRENGIRSLPVVDADDFLSGIVTVDDILYILSDMLIELVHIVNLQRKRETQKRP